MSSNKTANLQLNQWAAGDSFLREEFNQDNAKLDTKVHTIETAALKIVSGQFKGDGANRKFVSVGFKPKMAIVSNAANTQQCAFIVSETCCFYLVALGAVSATSSADGYVKLTDTGFYIDNAVYNNNGETGYYIAFG